MTKTTVYLGIDPAGDGVSLALQAVLFVRLQKRVTDDDDEVVSAAEHSFSARPGIDWAAMFGMVNAQLVGMGFPAISDADMATIQADAAARWPIEIVAAYDAQVAAENAAVSTPDVASTIVISSVARLTVADGDVSGVDLSANIGAALYLGVGNYMLFFNNSELDTSYLVRGFLDGFVEVTDQETDSFMVQCTDRTGTAFDPATLQIETLRVQ